MKNYYSAIFTIALFFCFELSAQKTNPKYSSLLIPKELTENANAVLRIDDTSIEISSKKSIKHSYKRVITVLNKNGNNKVNAYLFYDLKTSIKKLEAYIYDSNGNLVKKYKKSDFEDQSAVSDFSLYEDNRVKFINYTPTAYPYTVEYTYTTVINNNTSYIPFWRPLEGYYISTENSSYKILHDKSIDLNIKENNFKNYNIVNNSKDGLLNYEAKKLKGLKPENLSLSFRNFGPKLMVSPKSFYYEGYYGTAKDWKSLGKWMYDELLVGRDQLPEETKIEIRALVKNINNPIEKAKIVYKYVQDNTRYISVQEGIGGIQPISAFDVDKVKYGDCKGLTNYTKSLLDIVGVTSYYTRLYASSNNKVSIDKDFVSFLGQTNHVILNIPNKGNDIWLECTSQTMPFGFLGDFTDDRDVLVITPEGGVIKRTPAYINETNSQSIKASINLLPNSNISASLTRTSYGTQYNDKTRIETYTKKELDKYYKYNVWDYNNNLEIQSTKLINNKDKIEFTEKLDVNIESFAKVRDSSYLFKLNVFNRITGIPKRYRNRQRSIEIDRGFIDKDEFIFEIPKGFSIIKLPQNESIENKFGTYRINFEKTNDSSFIYKREFSLKKGIHPKEDYKAYRKFRKTVAKYDNLRMELIKN